MLIPRKNDLSLELNKNALGSVESRLFVDKIRSEEANRVRAFVTRGGGGGEGDAPHIKGLAMLFVLLRPGCKFRILVSLTVFWAKRYYI